MSASDSDSTRDSIPARDDRDFQRAVNRLEGAVDELVTMAKEQFSDRATSFVQDTADRLEHEIAERRGRQRRPGSRRRHRRRDGKPDFRGDFWNGRGMGRMWSDPSYWGVRPGPRGARDNPYRTRRLYRDVKRQRIAGVCAGIARYFGVEAWVVRCIAATGLIFMSQIVVPAYLIAWWVIEPAPNGDKAPEMAATGSTKVDHSSPAPELGARLSPRRSLRDVQYGLDQIELKLRRMETHVTSGQYELQRELKKIDT